MVIEVIVMCAALAGCGGSMEEIAPRPLLPAAISPAPDQVEWEGLARSSLRFLSVMHGFRAATEPGTRAGGSGLGRDYLRSVGSLHGWADGDPFYVNYVGHPMQGAVAGRLWMLHDPRYRKTEFGSSAAYWKGRLRAAAFSWAFSEQFELGPLSEASIGHIQKYFPQQGFGDHVVTPVAGLGWMIGEDALDRYVIKKIEARTANPVARILARSFLNPARAFANAMDWRVPWYRDSRPGVLSYDPDSNYAEATIEETEAAPRTIAPMEVTATAGVRRFGDDDCVGGGAEAAYRVSPEWQIVATVNGCKMTGWKENVSGDTLIYQIGPRWTPSPAGKWSPYAHVLIGGIKKTQEVLDPAEKQAVLDAHKDIDPLRAYTLHGMYTTQQESNALAVTAGMGLDLRIKPALAIRVASLEYLHSPTRLGPGSGFQMTTGMVLRWGTW